MAYIGKSPDGTGVRSRFYYTQTSGGGTSVSGSSDDGTSLAFSDGAYVDVFLNGVLLVAGTDYNTSTANTIAGLAALANGDVVEVVVYDIFTVADTVSASQGGTFNAGVTIADDLTVADKIIHSGDTDTAIRFPAADNISFETGGGEKMVIDNTGVIINDDSADLDFRVEGNNTAHLIFADGGNDKVGFGASVPTQRVSIEGTANDQSSELKVTATAVASGYIGPNSSGLNIGTDTAGIVFKTGVTGGGSVGNTGTERARIDSSGNVLVDCTALPSGGAGGAGFEAGASDGRTILQLGTTSTGAGMTVARFYNPNGAVGNITMSGSSTAFNTSSDHRLKENVADMTGAIDRVKALAPKRFNFIADADTTVDGFLAHEAQAVVPEAITGTHNEVDEDGNAVMQGIDQSKLVPLLTGALQEAIAKIETLETKVTALEAAE